MQYLTSFLAGIATFISPCLLPMLPIYISYFVGNKGKGLSNSIAFVLGFSIVYTILGAFAASVGKLVESYRTEINIITGIVIIILGLSFMGVLKIPFLNKTTKLDVKVAPKGFFKSLLFGVVFSIGWTPCTGPLLTAMLLSAANTYKSISGVFILLSYSLGLGIPFIISALLIDKLKNVFDFIKRNYKTVNIISGGFLVLIGLLTMFGLMQYFSSALTF